MKNFESILSEFLSATESIKSNHKKYGTQKIFRRRGRGRGLTLPYLRKCKKKSLNPTLSFCEFDEEKGYYRFWSYHNKYLRRLAAKNVRKYSDDIGDYAFYKKIFDYQWSCW
ncbi:MAG: hypothetical protein IJ685_02145 [Selenomonadaceae bacterium]|nr:hypothetical protein [Selenomonadaceae bacterium]